MSKLFLGILSLFLVFSCATTKNFQDHLQNWVGHDSNELVQHLGIPSATYETPDGGKIYEYHFNGGAVAHSNYTALGVRTYAVSYYCKVDFTTNKSGIIKTWRWEGNACKSKK